MTDAAYSFLAGACALSRRYRIRSRVSVSLISSPKLAGINDSDEEIDAIASLLAGKYAMMNFIPYNTVNGLAFRRPEMVRAVALAGQLQRRGIVTRLRDSAGQDIDGACGQLRARSK
mgnify:CR=1 FL=1